MIMEKKRCCKCNQTKASDKYPGVAVNDGDNDKVNVDLVKERTKTLNNNPRNDQ